MSQWRKIALGDVLTVVNRFEAVTPDSTYPLLGVRLEGNGAFLRETVLGTETSATRLNRVRQGDFIYSRLFAWRGAFGLIGPDLDGSFVSNEFPIFAADAERVSTAFLRYWFRLPSVWRRVEEDCTGSTPTTRNRYKEQFFLSLEAPLPPLAEQQAVVSRLDALADKVRQVNDHLDAIERDADRLLAVRFRDAIAGAPVRPMAVVAPLVRREVTIELEGSYPELGIRSFGKGTFHKPPLSGADVGTKRLFSIEPGDLLFSNVFAWEGAIAVAQPVDAGRFGSHRFITCRVDPDITSPEFLRYYFLTDAGLEKIGEASPGGAGRNRTLGLEKLMAIQVPIPSRPVQRAFDALQAKVAELKARHATIRQANDALIPAMLERVFSSAD
ncbi:restriction endonuclease subunit S [Immundisolibacter sp.]